MSIKGINLSLSGSDLSNKEITLSLSELDPSKTGFSRSATPESSSLEQSVSRAAVQSLSTSTRRATPMSVSKDSHSSNSNHKVSDAEEEQTASNSVSLKNGMKKRNFHFEPIDEKENDEKDEEIGAIAVTPEIFEESDEESEGESVDSSAPSTPLPPDSPVSGSHSAFSVITDAFSNLNSSTSGIDPSASLSLLRTNSTASLSRTNSTAALSRTNSTAAVSRTNSTAALARTTSPIRPTEPRFWETAPVFTTPGKNSATVADYFKTQVNWSSPPDTLSGLKDKGQSGIYFFEKKQPPVKTEEKPAQPKQFAAVFKPEDEEGGKIKGDDGVFRSKLGMIKGEAKMNEAVVYYLGSKYGISVPLTAVVSFGEKTGSIQKFEPGKKVSSMKPEELDGHLKEISRQEFHDLFFLDLLTGNTDRHAGNLMVHENHFVKFDHSCCLTANATNKMNFCWLKWTNAALDTPFERSWILRKKMCWKKDVKAIKAAFPKFSDEALDIFRLNMHLLKVGSKVRLTPRQMAEKFMGEFGKISIVYQEFETKLKQTRKAKNAHQAVLKNAKKRLSNEIKSVKTALDKKAALDKSAPQTSSAASKS